ncbi:MAG: carboxypeptidase-like regulatory domain-containing protein [Bacteroidia bacterium]|nr:carboxypeptidase-like regulatory domain-containing protein [Bacteroidia bacterium]
MKNKLTLIIGIVAVMFLWQACEFVKVNTPDLNLSKHYQAQYVINGVVVDENSTPVVGADVSIGNNQVVTDNNGAYGYKTENYPANGTLIKVVKDGYVVSSSSVVNNGNPPLMANYDFTLTRRSGGQLVSAVYGGTYDFNGVTVDVPAGNNFTVNGVVQATINLDVTTLNILSMMGQMQMSDVVGRTLRTFSFEPNGTVFDKPIKITFAAPDGFVYSTDLNYLVLNESSNIWEKQINQVKYDAGSNSVSVEVGHFSSGKVVDPATISYSLTPTVQYEFKQRLTASSCDCEGPYVYEGEYNYTRIIVNAYTGPSAATWQELNLFNILADNYIPYNASLVSGINTIGVINPVALGTCDLLTWDLSYVVRRVAGSFTYNSEVKYFDVKYYFAISSVFDDTQNCPVSSGCHQGCP